MQGATVQGTAVRVNTTLHMYSQMMMRSTHTAMSLVVSREGSIWIWSRKKKLRNNFKNVYACILKYKYVTHIQLKSYGSIDRFENDQLINV